MILINFTTEARPKRPLCNIARISNVCPNLPHGGNSGTHAKGLFILGNCGE